MSENDAWLRMIRDEPLLAFSLYSSIQARFIREKAELLRDISNTWTDGTIHRYDEYMREVWFWVLGAYEFFRTLDQNKRCFSARLQRDVTDLKTRLAIIRMPFAKQELRGNSGPVYDEHSVAGFAVGLVFEIGGKKVDTGELIDAVLLFLGSIEPDDVLSRIP